MISVIIPCYNDGDYIGRTIESVLCQTYAPVEVVAVNDGSSDRSAQILESYSDQIQIIHQENQGASAARNRGAELAEGEYLMFLDADDLIAPDTLSGLQEALDNTDGGEVIAVCPWKTLWLKEGEWVSQESSLSLEPPKGDLLYGWLSGWYIPPCAILWPRVVYDHVGGWDEEIMVNDDTDVMMRAGLKGVNITKAERGMSFYRNYREPESSKGGGQSREALRSKHRVLEKIGQRIRKRGLQDAYSVVLGQRYYALARKAALVDDGLYHKCLRRAYELANGQAPVGPLTHRVASAVLGLQRKEKIAAKLAAWELNPGWGVNSP